MYSLTERWRRLCSSELRVDYHIYISYVFEVVLKLSGSCLYIYISSLCYNCLIYVCYLFISISSSLYALNNAFVNKYFDIGNSNSSLSRSPTKTRRRNLFCSSSKLVAGHSYQRIAIFNISRFFTSSRRNFCEIFSFAYLLPLNLLPSLSLFSRLKSKDS